jgi:hypothetical protein
VYAFGQSADPKNWNASKQRVKSNKETTADGKYSLNDLPDNLKRIYEKAYFTELKNGVPAPATLKQYQVNFLVKMNSGRRISLHSSDLLNAFKWRNKVPC